jgi:hypothetical protein
MRCALQAGCCRPTSTAYENCPTVNRAACFAGAWRRCAGDQASELGGVLQDAHYREQDYADGENGHGHNAKGEQGPHGQFPQWPPECRSAQMQTARLVNPGGAACLLFDAEARLRPCAVATSLEVRRLPRSGRAVRRRRWGREPQQGSTHKFDFRLDVLRRPTVSHALQGLQADQVDRRSWSNCRRWPSRSLRV